MTLYFSYFLNIAEKVLSVSRIEFPLNFWHLRNEIVNLVSSSCMVSMHSDTMLFCTFSWLLDFWFSCLVVCGFGVFFLLISRFQWSLCYYGNVITEAYLHVSCWLVRFFWCMLSQKMVCHGEHTYLFAQSMMSILAQEEQGGSAVRRIAQEVQRYAHEK